MYPAPRYARRGLSRHDSVGPCVHPHSVRTIKKHHEAAAEARVREGYIARRRGRRAELVARVAEGLAVLGVAPHKHAPIFRERKRRVAAGAHARRALRVRERDTAHMRIVSPGVGASELAVGVDWVRRGTYVRRSIPRCPSASRRGRGPQRSRRRAARRRARGCRRHAGHRAGRGCGRRTRACARYPPSTKSCCLLLRAALRPRCGACASA